ncbi:hypothetical protein EV182_001251, partial [Spiromyces aspiralis]
MARQSKQSRKNNDIHRYSTRVVTSIALILSGFLPAEAAMTGSNAITPHNYVDMGASALANNPPSCGMPYATLDIGRITAVQAMNAPVECGTCLRVITNADDCGATPPIPYTDESGTIDTDKFLQDQANYQSNQLAALGKKRRGLDNLRFEQRRADVENINKKRSGGSKRWVYVLAVDTGGQGLDMSQVSFSALFQQPSNPTAAEWHPVDSSFCSGIYDESSTTQRHSRVSEIKVYTGDDPYSHDTTTDNSGTNSGHGNPKQDPPPPPALPTTAMASGGGDNRDHLDEKPSAISPAAGPGAAYNTFPKARAGEDDTAGAGQPAGSSSSSPQQNQSPQDGMDSSKSVLSSISPNAQSYNLSDTRLDNQIFGKGDSNSITKNAGDDSLSGT